MNQGFKDWLIRDLEGMCAGGRQDFLRALKTTPDLVVRMISNHIAGWGMEYSIGRSTGLVVNEATDPPELLQALKEHFAKELAAIPKEPATASQQVSFKGKHSDT